MLINSISNAVNSARKLGSLAFSITNSYLLDGTTEYFENTADLAYINNIISGTNKQWTIHIALKAGELGVTDYIFSDNGFNFTLRKNTTNKLQIVLKDGGAFKSATSNTALNNSNWYLISLTHNGLSSLGSRTKIYLDAVDDTLDDTTTNNIDTGTSAFRVFAKTSSEGMKGNFQLLSILDIESTPTQVAEFYNTGKPLNPNTKYGLNSKLFLNPDNSGDTAQFTITDDVNAISFVSADLEDVDKVADSMYTAAVIGIGLMQIGTTFIIG
jgi:hypothetical protein